MVYERLPTLTAERSAAPIVAFLLAGAARDVRPRNMAESFHSNIVGPLRPGNLSAVFVVLKAIHRNGEPYNTSEYRTFAATLQAVLGPARALVTSDDWIAREVAAQAHRLRSCAFTVPAHPEMGERIMRNWWGALSVGWKFIESHEREQAMRFDDVILARADLDYSHPIGPYWVYDTARFWYLGPTPLDAFWLLSRPVAADVLPSLTSIWDREAPTESAASSDIRACPSRMRKAHWHER